MKLRIPRLIRIRGLAFRHSMWLILTSGIILLLPFLVSYFTLTASLSELLEDDATTLYYRIQVRMNLLKDIEMELLNGVSEHEITPESDDEVRDFMRQMAGHDTLVSFAGFSLIPDPGYSDAPPMHFRMYDRIPGQGHALPLVKHYSTDSLYTRVKSTGFPAWSELYRMPADSNMFAVDYVVPLYREISGKRQFTGVFRVEISMYFLERLLKGYRGYFLSMTQFGDRSYAVMMTAEERVFLSTNRLLTNKTVAEITDSVIRDDLRYCIEIADSIGSSYDVELKPEKEDEKSRSAHLIRFRDSGWYFVVVFGAHKLLHVINIIFLVFYGIFIAILLIAYIVRIRKIAIPIQRLAEVSRKLGQREFDVKFPKRKRRDEIAQLTGSLVFMRDELQTYIATLKETTEAKEKIESELKVAHGIQMGMLPQEFAMPENWELYATLDPARAVGGDLYDFFYIDPEHLCIAIGDVAGKGVPGSLFMMVARTLLRSTAKLGLPVNEMIGYINQELCRENPSEMFVTFFAGIVDLRTGEMEFCNAGHNYPYIVQRDGRLQQLRIRSGIPMGIFADTTYNRELYTFNPQEALILVTDGITEAQNVSDDFFGEDNLAAALVRLAGRNTKEITELLIVELKRFAEGAEQSDDITILSLRYMGRQE